MMQYLAKQEGYIFLFDLRLEAMVCGRIELAWLIRLMSMYKMYGSNLLIQVLGRAYS
jgi:hypothetical protein